jgi:hypothetical protein
VESPSVLIVLAAGPAKVYRSVLKADPE